MHQRRRLSRPVGGSHPVRSAITATVTSLTLVAAAAFGGQHILQTQSIGESIGAGDMRVTSSSESLAAGADVTVADAAVATQGDGSTEHVVKEFTRSEPFSVFALTWTGDRDVVAYVRSQSADGTWSEWFPMDAANNTTLGAKAGTEPIYVEPTTKVQVSTGNIDLLAGGRTDSTAATTASDIEAVFIDGGEGTAQGDIAPVADTYAQGMPNVISRAQWGAGYNDSPTYDDSVTAATVHHTAGSNNYTAAEAPGIVRAIWAYHANTLGWGDIGYNALVDKYGNIYEGRYGGLDKAVEGAHVGGFNENTWGVSMLGDYQSAAPTNAAIQAMGNIIGWKAAVSGFDPTGSSYHYADFTYPGSRYSAGQGAVFPNINAHRDFHYNTCPGDYLYNRMGDIRTIAKAKYDALRSGKNGGTTSSAPATNANTNTQSGTVSAPSGTTKVTVSDLNKLINSNTVSLDGLAKGDPQAIAAAAGTIAGTLILLAKEYGVIDGISSDVAGLQLIPGLSLATITPYINPILQFLGNSEATNAWSELQPLLGKLVATTGTVGTAQYAFYNNGIGVRDANGEVFSLAGRIADAWLQQGLDAGPLGLPTSQPYSAEGGHTSVDFEGGTVTFNENSGEVSVDVK
ncbi:N-acetylmuramoyl-L-alanine amidase [Corynebacterium capitovis DSM 44611]|uniref:N-acetylmuramoyl-L-alanine amidase n=1 Tax=Corynebacterium capitovis TaxID=131081 RepID=UPI000361AED4|nr:N-acetylmuramoyl-L-alanine amidase [Corynebacterium capitovis]WKD58292.1 N-acetylmuramoyl-L-alanine amidase [Corynebacterium capitovis DSM 44611]